MGCTPKLYADNLLCVCRDPDLLVRAARFTTCSARRPGFSPAKCSLPKLRAAIRGAVLVTAAAFSQGWCGLGHAGRASGVRSCLLCCLVSISFDEAVSCS